MPLAISTVTDKKTNTQKVAIQMQDAIVLEPVVLLRQLREQFPREWDMVNRELILPSGERMKRVNGNGG